MDWDVFISHAWEDKESFARPLAEALQREGLRVWFDEFTLTVGDSLRRSIDYGLANSRYGIVILSPNFFAKEWPQKELDGLASREVPGEKVILPVWHNITAEQIRKYSPMLAGRIAVSSSRGLEGVVTELLRAMKIDSIRKPNVVVVTTKGEVVRGWLIKVLKENEVSMGIATLIVAILACVGTYLTVPQVQTFIAWHLATATATLPLQPTSTSVPIATYTPLQTLTPTFTIAPSPTLSPTLTITPIPTPDCRGVQISKSLELDLATKLGQKKDPDGKGVIVLTPDDLDKLQTLDGRAIHTETDVADGCVCEWHGQVNGSDIPAKQSPIRDCRFSIDLGERPTTISLWLTVGAQVKLFTIKVGQ